MLLTDLVPGPLKKLLPTLVAILLILLSVHAGFSQERGDRVLTGRVVSEDTGEPLSNVLRGCSYAVSPQSDTAGQASS